MNEDIEDKVLKTCFTEGLLGAFWVKRQDTLEIIGLRLIFENGTQLFLGSKDQKEIIIEVVNQDGFIQCNSKGT